MVKVVHYEKSITKKSRTAMECGASVYGNRELKQQRRQRRRKGHLKINIWENGDYFVIIAFSSHPLLLTERTANGLVEAALK